MLDWLFVVFHKNKRISLTCPTSKCNESIPPSVCSIFLKNNYKEQYQRYCKLSKQLEIPNNANNKELSICTDCKEYYDSSIITDISDELLITKYCHLCVSTMPHEHAIQLLLSQYKPLKLLNILEGNHFIYWWGYRQHHASTTLDSWYKGLVTRLSKDINHFMFAVWTKNAVSLCLCSFNLSFNIYQNT